MGVECASITLIFTAMETTGLAGFIGC
jgi:hypothetical protein